MIHSCALIAHCRLLILVTLVVCISPVTAQEPSATKTPTPNSPVDEDELNRRKADFSRRDRDEDGKLTLEEQIGNWQGPQRIAARDSFFRLDVDEDGVLTQDEFVSRQRNRPISTSAIFRQMDLDENGLLTEDEVLRLKKNFEEAARLNFHRFDVNRDKQLNVREFAMMPAQKPTAETMFAGLDADSSGGLTSNEFLAIINENSLRRAHREFFQRDVDGDNQLSLTECLTPSGELPTPPPQRFELFDVDGDGWISLVELCDRPPPLTSDEVDEQRYEIALMKAEDQFSLADANGDGKLNREDWEGMGPISTNMNDEPVEPAGSASAAAASSTLAATEWDPFLIAMILADVALVAAVAGWWFTHRRPRSDPADAAVAITREQPSPGP